MLLADKLIKRETGVGTEKGATWLQIINLLLLGFTPEENDLARWVGAQHKRGGQGGKEGRKDRGMKKKGREERTRRGAWTRVCRGRAARGENRKGVGKVDWEWMEGMGHEESRCFVDSLLLSQAGPYTPKIAGATTQLQGCISPGPGAAAAQASLLASNMRLLRGSVTDTQDGAPVVLTPASPCLQVLQDPSHSLFWCKALAQRFSPLSLLVDLVVNSHPCRNVPVNLCSPSSVPSSSRWKRVPSTQSLGRPGIRWVRTNLSDSRSITRHWWVLWACSPMSLAHLLLEKEHFEKRSQWRACWPPGQFLLATQQGNPAEDPLVTSTVTAKFVAEVSVCKACLRRWQLPIYLHCALSHAQTISSSPRALSVGWRGLHSLQVRLTILYHFFGLDEVQEHWKTSVNLASCECLWKCRQWVWTVYSVLVDKPFPTFTPFPWSDAHPSES